MERRVEDEWFYKEASGDPEDQDSEESSHPEMPEDQDVESISHPEVPKYQHAKENTNTEVPVAEARDDGNTNKTP